MFKPFYIHIHRQPGKMSSHFSRGFTVKISPDLTEPHKRVNIQVAFCSSKDQFCKKTGRKEADQKETQLVSKRSLPYNLVKLTNRVGGKDWYNENEFFYLYKYVL